MFFLQVNYIQNVLDSLWGLGEATKIWILLFLSGLLFRAQTWTRALASITEVDITGTRQVYAGRGRADSISQEYWKVHHMQTSEMEENCVRIDRRCNMGGLFNEICKTTSSWGEEQYN